MRRHIYFVISNNFFKMKMSTSIVISINTDSSAVQKSAHDKLSQSRLPRSRLTSQYDYIWSANCFSFFQHYLC